MDCPLEVNHLHLDDPFGIQHWLFLGGLFVLGIQTGWHDATIVAGGHVSVIAGPQHIHEIIVAHPLHPDPKRQAHILLAQDPKVTMFVFELLQILKVLILLILGPTPPFKADAVEFFNVVQGQDSRGYDCS
jgi:hypothetical protein